jgi:hypothetical protein
MRDKTRNWIRGLVSAVVTGGSSAALASLGISGANAVGVPVPQLDIKQLGAVVIGGGIVGMLAYLKQSPIPPDSGNTDFLNKPSTPPSQ